jgi:multiple sugar transport system permease protein
MSSPPSLVARPAERGSARAITGFFSARTVTGLAHRKALLGYLFLLPTVGGLLVFTAGPVLASFALSFFDWNLISDPQFVGLDKFRAFFHDSRALGSFVTTGLFTVMAVTLQITLGLLLALGVQRRMGKLLRYYFRSAFFLPLLTSAASVSIVFSYLFNERFGPVNYYLGKLGIPAVPWLNDPTWALISVVLLFVWQNLGFTFILFIGALANIPSDILDAAKVDGARGWSYLRRIVVPMISPTMLFAAVIGVINAIQLFDQAYVLTRGGPGDSTRSVVMIIFESAFRDLDIGYGSVVAVFLFLVILAVTGLQFWMSKRWVFYR